VPAGEVKVTAGLGSATATVPVTVTAGKTEELDVVLGSGTLALNGKRSAAASENDNGIRWDVTDASGDTQTAYGGEAKFNLPAGDYTVKATLGEAVAEVKVSVPAGKTVSQEIIVATGKIVAHALFAEGGPAVTASPRFDVLSAEKGEDGERKGIATAYNDGSSFDLPPGKYVLRATSDAAIAEAGIEVKAGQPQEISVVLNAGLLALTAPGADRLDVLGGKKDIYGKQEGIATTYAESWQFALPAGDYVVKVTKKDGSEKTAPASIKAGERTELTVE
jgi:Ca-activated chloride channel family protein